MGRTGRAAQTGKARNTAGRRVCEFRKEPGISFEDMPAQPACTDTYVGGIERGERNPGLVNVGALVAAPPERFESVLAGRAAGQRRRPAGSR